MAGVKSYSVVAANNVLANTGFTMDEGMSPSSVNDSVRQLMADVRTEWAQGADIASASTTDLSAATGGYVFITGTTTITAFGTASAGIRRKLKFSGALTLTHNATSLILPTGADIVTIAGDTCEAMSEGSGNWRVLWYTGNTVPAVGIKFPAVQVASSNANTLDDYEEGTWTPIVGGTATYLTQTGRYTKIGRLVHVECLLTINAIGTGSTSVISGLPFNTFMGTIFAVGNMSASTATNIVSIVGLSTAGQATISLISRTAASAADAVNAIFANGATVSVSGSYSV